MTKKTTKQSNPKNQDTQIAYEVVGKTADSEAVYLFTKRSDALKFREAFIACGGKGHNIGTPENPQGLPLESVSKVRRLVL